MVDLTKYNTLRVPVSADQFLDVTDFKQLPKLPDKYFILGHGANTLFTKDFPGLVLKISVTGFKVISETDIEVFIEAQAGQDWHELVTWTVNHNLSGMENMPLIPGTVGAAVVGNIGAYGQTQEDIFESINTTEGKFTKSEMSFAYRESFLKSHPEILVTSVTYKLSRIAHLNLTYSATRHTSLLPELQRMQALQKKHAQPDAGNDQAVEHVFSKSEQQYSISDVYQAVINLRNAKLPKVSEVGTAGSFFKNPLVSPELAATIKKSIPDLQVYPERLKGAEWVKLPAGMLLDTLGWRGKRIGNVGTWPSHALLVCNFGGATTGEEIYSFSENMRADVKKNFGIDLAYEVVVV